MFTGAVSLLILQIPPKGYSNKAKLNWYMWKARPHRIWKTKRLNTVTLLPIEIVYLRLWGIERELKIMTIIKYMSERFLWVPDLLRAGVVGHQGRAWSLCTWISILSRILNTNSLYPDPLLFHGVPGNHPTPSILAPSNTILSVPLNVTWPQKEFLTSVSYW